MVILAVNLSRTDILIADDTQPLGDFMAGFVVFIICVILAVLTFRKVSKHSRNKGRGKLGTLIMSSVVSFLVFVISLGVATGIVSKDKEAEILSQQKNTEINDKSAAVDSPHEAKTGVYICNKFDAITQTRQGTKRNSGYYSDTGVLIEYTLSDNELINRMPIPGDKDSIDVAKFNNIADDGSRKYGSKSINYFVYVMNDSAIKVVSVDFTADMTITQICSK